MTEPCTENIELFGIMRRLPEITTLTGTLAVSKLLESAHDSSIIELYWFIKENLGITQDQFREGYETLLGHMNSEDGVLTREDAIVGYVGVNGIPMTFSWKRGRVYMTSHDAPDAVWPPGTIVLSPGFIQPV